MAITIANLTARQFEIDYLILAYLVAVEFVLWVDGLIGWDHVPLIRQASHLLQRRVTTRQPSDREMQTAQRALEILVSLHHPPSPHS